MRVLLDKCVPRSLRRELPGHEVRTVAEMGWTGTRNGLLLRNAAVQFDAFLTVDPGIEFQQHLTGVDLAVISMAAPSNSIDDLRPLVPQVLTAISSTLLFGRVTRRNEPPHSHGDHRSDDDAGQTLSDASALSVLPGRPGKSCSIRCARLTRIDS